MAKILVVEDDWSLADMTARGLRESGHEVTVAGTLDEGLRQIEESVPDLVITDLMLDDKSGLDMLRQARDLPQPPEVILITAHPTALTAAQAMQGGAYEYLTKPYSLAELNAIIERVCARRSLVAAATPMSGASGKRELIAESAAMKETLALADEAAASASTVLLRGESGVGKEEVAMFIHSRSPRANEPFIAINCGAMPESLLASELFGHEKGAFTGAVSRRAGAFERAAGGTLLIDEIGDIPAATQIHLLRAIEAREITRVGSDKTVRLDVRLLAATHRNLEELLRDGKLREDLYYRINVITIQIPPLRERRADVPPLAHHFVRQSGATPDRLSPQALEILQAYTWPGNVRELRNIVENLLIRSRGATISAELVSSVLPTTTTVPSAGESPSSSEDTLEEMEAARIREALRAASGNKASAARALGISRRRLYSRIKILDIK
jgi:DNA-binding NtrC family response regulator